MDAVGVLVSWSSRLEPDENRGFLGRATNMQYRHFHTVDYRPLPQRDRGRTAEGKRVRECLPRNAVRVVHAAPGLAWADLSGLVVGTNGSCCLLRSRALLRSVALGLQISATFGVATLTPSMHSVIGARSGMLQRRAPSSSALSPRILDQRPPSSVRFSRCCPLAADLQESR